MKKTQLTQTKQATINEARALSSILSDPFVTQIAQQQPTVYQFYTLKSYLTHIVAYWLRTPHYISLGIAFNWHRYMQSN